MSCHTDTRKECQIIKREEKDKRIKPKSHIVFQFSVWPSLSLTPTLNDKLLLVYLSYQDTPQARQIPAT